MSPTNYIVFDMEWNQPPCAAAIKSRNGIELHGEIIQIGAVKMDKNFNITDTVKIDVRPSAYKKIAKRIESITGISTESARLGRPFDEAADKFRRWCGEDFCFLTWGSDDVKVLHDNLVFFGQPCTWIPENNFDLQIIFDYLTQKKGRQFSLDFALEYYAIEVGEKRHDAYNDASYTALVCREMKPFKCIEHYRDVLIEKVILQQEQEPAEDYIRKVQVLDSLNLLKGYKIACEERVECPECKRKAALKKRYRKSDSSYAFMYSCSKHGDFVSLLRMRPIESYHLTRMVRNTYRPGDAENVKAGLKAKKWRAV